MAWLDRAIRRLVSTEQPQPAVDAAADARRAARCLARTMGEQKIPMGRVEQRIDALVRLDVPAIDARGERRRGILAEQLRHWASEAYEEARDPLREKRR
jgi:hypothetical protein